MRQIRLKHTYRLLGILAILGIISTALAINGDSAPNISNVDVMLVTETSAIITFRVDQLNTRTVIQYGTTADLGTLSEWDNRTSRLKRITLNNLLKGTKYYFSVYAYNNQNHFSNSAVQTFTTRGDPDDDEDDGEDGDGGDETAPRISNIREIGITYSSVNISFSVDQRDAKTIVHYGNNRNLENRSGWNNDTSTQRNIMLSDLSSNTTYYYSIFAYNGTNDSVYSNSTIRNFRTDEEEEEEEELILPRIVSTSPEKIIQTVEEEPVNFTISFDQTVNVTWYLNGTKIKTQSSTRFSYYYNNSSSIGTWNVTAVGKNRNGSISYSWTWIVHPITYTTGNRIWDGTKGMSTTYIWNSHSFAGFYYDLDNNILTEELKIKDISRSIARGNIIYKTSTAEVNFDYSGFGKYQVIGFMADKYFAGYTDKSIISGKREISTIGSGQMHKVLIDNDEKRTVTVGGTLTLKEGYVLKMKEVDIGAGAGQIWVVLLKDGGEVDSAVISAGDNYVYKRRVGVIDSLPIIAIHFDSVFRGRETEAAFVKGIFQISDTYTRIESGVRYGKMEISAFSRDNVQMENRETISLSAGSKIDLMGNLRIIVADSDTLRFELSVEKTAEELEGSKGFEARGTVYSTVKEWTPLNFGLNIGGSGDSKNVGFYYDIDEDIGTETLKITNINGRSIRKGDLIYSTSPQEISFDYSKFGKYQVIGFLANKYFAGYTTRSVISGNKEINTIGYGQLHKIILDDSGKRTLIEGSTLTLSEGYVLKMKEVDIGAGKGNVWVVLLKDGGEIDNSVVSGGDTYIFSRRIGSVDNLPIIAIHFDTVFRGREANAVFVDGVFQISEKYTAISSGNIYDKMEISDVNKNKITMQNKNTIELSSGNIEDIMGDIKFRVADSNELRFYPYVLVTSDMVANKLIIDAPSKAVAGDRIDIRVTAGGTAVEGVYVSIGPNIGPLENKTNQNGNISFEWPISSKGTYTITANKLGYLNANKTIEIEPYLDRKLNIDAPIMADQFETISIKITANNTPINNVIVNLDNDTAGITNNNGILNYTLQISGNHTIRASKSGYITSNREIYIRPPYSEFKAIDINLNPDSIFENDKVYIISNITNVGTKIDDKNIELLVDEDVVGEQLVTIGPKGTKEISFTYKASLKEGNYTVKILEQERLLEVKKSPLNMILIGVIVTTIGMIVIYIVTAKEKLSWPKSWPRLKLFK